MSLFNKQDRRNRSLGASIYYHGSPLADVQKKIEAGGDVNSVYKTDYERHPLIRWAAERGRDDIVKLLLSHGANPNAGEAENDGALFAAVERRYQGIAETLLKAGAKVDERTNRGDAAFDGDAQWLRRDRQAAR